MIQIFLALLLVIAGLSLLSFGEGVAPAHAQQPTVAVATVTGTPIGPYITVNADQEDPINVRTGPGTEYEAIGVLIRGEIAPAKGRSAAGLWILVVYPGVEGGLGWVYAPLVTLSPDAASLPIIEPPPTPTAQVTPTINPSLAAQFIFEIPATRLPTFTAVDPLQIPEYEQSGTGRLGGIPIGMFITGLGLMGIFGAAVAYLRER
ncbi:MAG: SH3 domain-containing protein [Anaerolineales bacterium]